MLLHTLWKPVLENKLTTKHMRQSDGESTLSRIENMQRVIHPWCVIL